MKSVFTVDQIRRAEERLFRFQSDDDELMISAASAVADVAQAMVAAPAEERILLLVGSGGNGGDALYAGAFLCEEGHLVDALLLGGDRVHTSALDYFTELGGVVLDEQPRHLDYHLVIDGILGIGGRGGLTPETARLVENFYSAGIPILAVDVPSGVAADTGATPEPVVVTLDGYDDDAPIARQKIPVHINADVTVTFGGLRRAHAVSAACGRVLLADIRVAGGGGLALSVALQEVAFEDDGARIFASTAWTADRERPVVPGAVDVGEQLVLLDVEPGPDSDKYSGGVVGIIAGDEDYPGAGVLACAGAVRATSAMVRYIGAARDHVIRAHPEVVTHPDLDHAGQVQAWVFGPGAGTGAVQTGQLRQLLGYEQPLLIDADGLTILAGSPELQALLRRRSAPTVLTPHRGEFERIAVALRREGQLIPDSAADPIGAALALATNLHCCVLLKGRFTVVATSDYVYVVNAGHSWSATPGSGDVLSGVIGAHLAQSYAELTRLPEYIPGLSMPNTAVYSQVAPAVSIHAVAAALSARTEFGPASTSASRIAEWVPAATARLNQSFR